MATYSISFTQEFLDFAAFIDEKHIFTGTMDMVNGEETEAAKEAEAIIDTYTGKRFGNEAILWGYQALQLLGDGVSITEEELDGYCIQNLDDDGVLVVEEEERDADEIIDNIDDIAEAVSDADMSIDGEYYTERLDNEELTQLVRYINDIGGLSWDDIQQWVLDATAIKNINKHPYSSIFNLAISDKETIESEENTNSDDWYEAVIYYTNSNIVAAYHHC